MGWEGAARVLERGAGGCSVSPLWAWRGRIRLCRQNIQSDQRLPQRTPSCFFFFPSSSIHEKEVRKLLISFHGGQPQQQLRQRQQLLPSSLATCAAILMKINMPLVGVAAYDFDICRHFALACPPRCLDGSPRCVCLSICLSCVYGMLKII